MPVWALHIWPPKPETFEDATVTPDQELSAESRAVPFFKKFLFLLKGGVIGRGSLPK